MKRIMENWNRFVKEEIIKEELYKVLKERDVSDPSYGLGREDRTAMRNAVEKAMGPAGTAVAGLPGIGKNQAVIFAVQVLDPTGITSIPEIPPIWEAYQKNKTIINTVLLVLAVLAAIPVAGKLAKVGGKALKGIKIALTGARKTTPKLTPAIDNAVRAIDNVVAPKAATASKAVSVLNNPVELIRRIRGGVPGFAGDGKSILNDYYTIAGGGLAGMGEMPSYLTQPYAKEMLVKVASELTSYNMAGLRRWNLDDLFDLIEKNL